MRLRYGMRLGRGLWVGGGPGIFVVYGFIWMLAAALATTIMIGFLIVFAIGFVIQLLIKKRRLRKRRQDDERWSQAFGQIFHDFKWSLCRGRVIHGAACASLATNANARHGG